MSLRDRLQRLRGSPNTASGDSTRPAVESDSLGGATSRHPTADAVEDAATELASEVAREPVVATTTSTRLVTELLGPEHLLPGVAHTTPFGDCYVAESRYALEHRHGRMPLAATLAVPRADATLLLARAAAERAHIQAADAHHYVYLDTETTGLAGGTGTYAFLIGVGRFIGAEFVVRQIFMRTLAEEYAALHLLEGMLADCEVLVTYNGKAFDWPLIETRYALARRGGPRRPEAPRAHVDLLFAARRLWRTRLESCTLGNVEQAMLGVRRGDDTPGWLIPQLYFSYLRERDVRPLVGVFRHNALDLLSLAALLGRVAMLGGLSGDAADSPTANDPARAGVLRAQTEDAAATAPSEWLTEQRATPADELLALGRCCEEDGALPRALAYYRAAVVGDGLPLGNLHARIINEARMRAGAVLKRQHRSEEALVYWEAALAERSRVIASDVRPFEELAKFHEHVRHDVAAARSYVLAALRSLDAYGAPGPGRTRARLMYRLRRLDATSKGRDQSRAGRPSA